MSAQTVLEFGGTTGEERMKFLVDRWLIGEVALIAKACIRYLNRFGLSLCPPPINTVSETVKFPPALADPPLYSATEYHRPNVRSEWRSMLYRGTVIYIVKLAIIIINLHSVEKHKFPPISTTSKDDSPFCTRNAGSK